MRYLTAPVLALGMLFAFAGFVQANETLPTQDASGEPVILAQAEVTAEPAAEPAAAEESADQGEATVTEEADLAAEEGEESKAWGVTFAYDFGHNFAEERKEASNSFSVSPSYMIPFVDINVGTMLGMAIVTRYDPQGGTFSGNRTNWTDVDMMPIPLMMSRRFSIDPDYTGFSVTVKANHLFPYVSDMGPRARKWYYAFQPGWTLGLAKWGVTLSNSTNFQINAHKYDTFVLEGDGYVENLVQWKVTNSTRLGYSYDLFSVGVSIAWARGVLYNTSMNDDPNDTPKNVMIYSADMGFDIYEGFAASLAFTTAGPERYLGGFGSDYMVPFDPRFTTMSIGLSYSL